MAEEILKDQLKETVKRLQENDRDRFRAESSTEHFLYQINKHYKKLHEDYSKDPIRHEITFGQYCFDAYNRNEEPLLDYWKAELLKNKLLERKLVKECSYLDRYQIQLDRMIKSEETYHKTPTYIPLKWSIEDRKLCLKDSDAEKDMVQSQPLQLD